MDKRHIWIDTDLSVGMMRTRRDGYCDVDDGYAILQLMKHDGIEIMGMSAVFGNTDIDSAYSLCKHMAQHYASKVIPVYRGAGAALQKGDLTTNEAVDALHAALKGGKLTIMAIGPATNIGLLLSIYPDIASQIEEVVLVAGRRRPTDAFNIGNRGSLAMDLNFDLDNDAFQILLQSGVKTTLCPFEISSKVWIKSEDLHLLSDGDTGCQWLAQHSVPWIEQWHAEDAEGFNPFDVLASHYIIAPHDIISEPLLARLELFPDDTKAEEAHLVHKNYLICDRSHGYPVQYCYDVVPDFHHRLLSTLI